MQPFKEREKERLSCHRKWDRAGAEAGALGGTVNKAEAWAERQEIFGIPGFPQKVGQGEGMGNWAGLYTTTILFWAESSPLCHRNVPSGKPPHLFHTMANAQGN